MAKRSNPYSDDYVQQSKTHIGLKQFNNNEDRLQKVYEKTLQLLYQGAKKTLHQNLLQCSNVSSTDNKHGMKFKQLFIGKDGGLQNSGTLVSDKSALSPRCPCSAPAADRCGYCERALCAACQQQCAVCLLLYCSKCCLNGSAEGTEICVSCYS